MNVWALGDYHRFAKATVWDLGPLLVDACRIERGQRVLDVGAGSGNVAIRAAQAGADVVASDLTAENLEAGAAEAQALGATLDWVVADVQDLPFDSGSFDVVTSCFGAMFAPDHGATAREMLRVCRPGGTIGMLNFTPDGLGGRFFGMFARYLPAPPPGAQSPLLWGDQEHLTRLFGGAGGSLRMTLGTYVERASSPRAYCELFRTTFGPLVSLYAALADRPRERARLDRDFEDFAESANSATDGTAGFEYEYLLVIAQKAREP